MKASLKANILYDTGDFSSAINEARISKFIEEDKLATSAVTLNFMRMSIKNKEKNHYRNS